MGGEPAAHHRAGGRGVLLIVPSGVGNARTIRLADGIRIRLEQTGTGTPLVLIPGWACSIDVFRGNIPAFAKRFCVFAYDPRSQGRSDQSATGNDYGQRGFDLHDLLEELGLERVALLGWSLGVFDVLSYLDQYGYDRIAALVLVDESPKIVKSNAGDWGEGDAEEVATLIATVAGPGYLPFFREYMAAGFEGPAPAELLNRMTEMAGILPHKTAAALLEDAARRDFTAGSRRAAERVPVLQLLRRDWADAASRWIAANQPSARIEVLGGHLMLMEYPEAFNRAVLSFLDTGQRRTPGPWILS